MKRGRFREAKGGHRAAAEALAVAALTFLAADSARLGRFLAATGIGPGQIRSAAGEPGFLAGVLDHLASEEQLLLAFARQEGIDPHDVMRAQTILSGAWERDVP